MMKICAYAVFFSSAVALITASLNSEIKPKVKVNKCCEMDEVRRGSNCLKATEAKTSVWIPVFTSEAGESNIQVDYEPIIGLPDCGSVQTFEIYHYRNSSDSLTLLPDGTLRHYLNRGLPNRKPNTAASDTVDFYDYQQGLYCLDKNVINKIDSNYAQVCAPKQTSHWTSTDFLMRNIVNPFTHAISMICLIIIAIVYFVLPTLRDLTGNIVTTVCISLIISQSADMTRLLTIFINHVNVIGAETVCYVALLGAFFWLNSLGYYIWKTFKSRNVFLRITDGKKYCYYSSYAWSCTLVMGFLAIFAHYTMDYPQVKKFHTDDEQERIGSLAMIIFFVPIAFTVLINIFFFSSTLRIINRMNTYGRIHHKLKHSFRMFLLMFFVMSLNWVFFLMSFSYYDGLVYAYIIVNAFQGPAMLYICLFDQKHVSYLFRKTCCYVNCICPCCRPEPEIEWGDEMQAMNSGVIY